MTTLKEYDEFHGECLFCGEPLDEPDIGDIHDDPGEFVAIKQRCVCGKIFETFYDFTRTELVDE